MSKSEYNFNKNLLKASSSNSLQEAKTEWVEVYEEVRLNKDGLCICQRNRLKFVKYFYNVKTKLTINVGSRCCKKFNFSVDKIKNKILEKIFKTNIVKGEYQVIDNIIAYTNSIENQLICHFEEYTNSKNIYQLKMITENIKYLIDIYKLDYLNDVYIILTNLIELIEKEKKEDEKLKIYCVEIHKRNYLPGNGTDIFISKHKFSSREECNKFISNLKIGITEISKYREENTIESAKILLNDEIIETFNKKIKTDERKQTDYEEKITNEGITYWYDSHKNISLYKNPYI